MAHRGRWRWAPLLLPWRDDAEARRASASANFRRHAISQLRRLGRLGLVYCLDPIENFAEIALRDLHVIVVLQVEPKLGGCPERLGESKRGISGNAALFAGDPLDP